MKHRITICVALVLAALALVIAGCGGDDDESSTTASDEVALSEEDFLAQGNEICAAGNKEIEAIANDVFTGREPTPEQLSNFAALLVENVQGQIDAIRALTPPEELADSVETFLSTAEDALGQVEEDPSVLGVSDNDDGPFADTNAQAVEIGLTECAS